MSKDQQLHDEEKNADLLYTLAELVMDFSLRLVVIVNPYDVYVRTIKVGVMEAVSPISSSSWGQMRVKQYGM